MRDMPLTFKTGTGRIRLIFYAVFFSILLFLVLPLSQMFNQTLQKKETVRAIDIIAKPPAPPPTEQKKEQVVEKDIIQIKSTVLDVRIEPLDVALDTRLSDGIGVKLTAGKFKIAGSGASRFEVMKATNLLQDIQTFSINELDETPRSLNDPLARTPSSLAGKVIMARVRIILTEKGTVIFQKIESINYPAAAKSVEEYVEKLKYTPPTRNGIIGRTEFILPVRIGAM